MKKTKFKIAINDSNEFTATLDLPAKFSKFLKEIDFHKHVDESKLYCRHFDLYSYELDFKKHIGNEYVFITLNISSELVSISVEIYKNDSFNIEVINELLISFQEELETEDFFNRFKDLVYNRVKYVES